MTLQIAEVAEFIAIKSGEAAIASRLIRERSKFTFPRTKSIYLSHLPVFSGAHLYRRIITAIAPPRYIGMAHIKELKRACQGVSF